MKSIQQIFDHQIKQALRPERVGTNLVAQRFKGMGIKLNRNQLARLERQWRKANASSFQLNVQIEDAQVINAGFSSEAAAQEALNTALEGLTTDVEKFSKEFNDALPRIIKETTFDLSEQLLKTLKRSAKKMLQDRRAERTAFEQRVFRLWRKALDLLEMHLVIALEAGSAFNTEFRPEAAKSTDCVFEVLTRLHARACQVTSEIIVLLRTGHADGAHARWRCLHEIAVTAIFIAKQGNDTAERYLLHKDRESYRAALQYQEYCERLGYTPLTEEELAKMQIAHQHLIERFGKSYDRDYGWASNAIGKEKPTFRDIEGTVSLDYLRPYYRMASHNIHANPQGIFFKLGLSPHGEDILMAGPSNVGLADPGHATALSLTQISVTLLTKNPNVDRLIVCDILTRLSKEIGENFLLIHNQLEKRIRKQKKQR
jgi:hypothetical protein